VREGAQVATGGKRPADPALAHGNFYEPTIFTNVAPWMRIAQEEIFGPFTVVIAYRDVDEAVRIANDVPFGLGASIWTADTAKALRLADRLDCGTIWINDHHRIDPARPWGGMKDSGLGREAGLEGWREYTQTKSVVVNLDEPTDWYASDENVRLS
jgi:acyl-CoA reductase-like NAD-dependent aldehyde dehydrogenase